MHSLPALRIVLHFEGGFGQFYTFLKNNTEMLDIDNKAPVKRIETYEHKMQTLQETTCVPPNGTNFTQTSE